MFAQAISSTSTTAPSATYIDCRKRVADQQLIERLDLDAPVFLPRRNQIGDPRPHREHVLLRLLRA